MEAVRTGKPLNNSINALKAYDYPGLLGVESATEYWGLSTFYGIKPIFLFQDNSQNNEGYESSIAINLLFVPNVNTTNVVYLSEHLSVTDPEQTVCDMVRYQRHEFHLFETLLNAYEGDVDIERLETLADQYGILERIRTLYQEALLVEGEG